MNNSAGFTSPCFFKQVQDFGQRQTALAQNRVGRVTDNRVVTVKARLRQEWLVAIEGRAADLAFSMRQLAIDFARAYAKLRRASTMQVFNATGVLEDEEKVDLSSRQSVKA